MGMAVKKGVVTPELPDDKEPIDPIIDPIPDPVTDPTEAIERGMEPTELIADEVIG